MTARPFASRRMPLALVLMLAASVAGAQEATTLIRGTLRSAVTNKPLVRAAVSAGLSDSVVTDSAGRFELSVPRSTWDVWFWREGYLDFRFPLLKLTTDTLTVDAVLRTVPRSAELYGINVCVKIPTPDRMSILSFCARDTHADSGYAWQGYKHNPWSPYFGRSVDCAGVVILTRDNGASVRSAPRVTIPVWEQTGWC